jgi:hypothetical protein
MYSQLLKKILLIIKHDENAKKEFIGFYRVGHVDNKSAFTLIDEFERNYDQRSSVSWYTRISFIYLMLNNALRNQDIEIILQMGFFVRDLHQQIEQLHSNSDDRNPLSVYRGQGMFNAEFEKMNNSECSLLFLNIFLSTSSNRDVSFAYADSVRDDPELHLHR